MLPSDEEKAYIVSYCQTQGSGMSKCKKCKEEGHQPNCSFYEKASYGTGCSNIRMGEYCGDFNACDFADGKDVHIENIPNMPSIKNRPMLTFDIAKEFIDTPHGRREIYKDREYHGRRRVMRKSDGRTIFRTADGPGYPETMKPLVKKVRDKQGPAVYHDEDGCLRDAHTGARVVQLIDGKMGRYEEKPEDSMDFHMGYYEEKLPTIDRAGNLKFLTPDGHIIDSEASMSEIMSEFEQWEDKMISNPCAEISIGVDNSGSMTPERFHELAGIVAEELRNQTLCIFMPVTKHVTMDHLYDCLNSYCGAYSEEFKLFLDMSDPNIYTIYNASGNFMSLRKLLDDGITPLQLNFKMVNGGTCFGEYGFEEFTDMIERMLVQDR